jgi:hypothetical protein
VAASARTRAAAAGAAITLLVGGVAVGTAVTDDPPTPAGPDVRTCPAVQDHAKVAAAEQLLARKGPVTRAQLRGALDTAVPCPAPEPSPSPSGGPTAPIPPTSGPTPTAPPATPTAPPQTPTGSPSPEPVGFPGPADTGAPDCADLRPSAGVTVTTPGAVIDGLCITGPLRIQADDVTVRRSVVATGTTYPVQVAKGTTGTRIEDSTVVGTATSSIAVFLQAPATLTRVDVSGARDGVRVEADDVTITASWVHDLTRVDGGHHDTLQVRKGRNLRVTGNSLIAWVERTHDPMNAAIQLGSFTGPVDGLIEGNRLDGGNNTINGGTLGVTIRRNVFGPHARYGLIGALGGATWSDNHLDDGTPAAA